MTARKDLPGAFGSHNIIQVPDVTEAERHRARLAVVEKCPDDARLMLAMLGLGGASC